MTAAEMGQEFLILYDKITNFDAPGYDGEEISILLSKAQERVVLGNYTSDNKSREGFEETELRRKDLKELVKGAVLSTASTTPESLPFGKYFTLPEDCLYVISEEITTSSSDECKDEVRLRVKPITHDEYSINVDNPFKAPDILTHAWRLDYEGGKHEIITNTDFDVDTYHIRYIKRLTPIITDNSTVEGVTGPQDCILDASIHRRIIDEAVKIATGITDPQYYEIKAIEQQQGEQ